MTTADSKLSRLETLLKDIGVPEAKYKLSKLEQLLELIETPVAKYQVLKVEEVVDRLKVGKSTIYQWMQRGQFPRPFRMGNKSVGWLESDINEWVETKLKASGKSSSIIDCGSSPRRQVGHCGQGDRKSA